MNRKQLIAIAKQNRDKVKIPLTGPTDQLRKFVRNAGLLPNEPAEFHWFSFPNPNLVFLVLGHFKREKLPVLKYQRSLTYEFWNSLFMRETGVKMKRKEFPNNDYIELIERTPREKFQPQKVQKWMAEHGYFDYFTGFDFDGRYRLYWKLLLGVVREKDWNGYQRVLSSSKVDLEDMFGDVVDVILTEKVPTPLEWIKLLIEHGIKELYRGLYRAVIERNHEVVDYLYTTMRSDPVRYLQPDADDEQNFMVEIISSGDQSLIGGYWKPTVFDEYNLVEIAMSLTQSALSNEQLLELIDLLVLNNPTIYNCVFRELSFEGIERRAVAERIIEKIDQGVISDALDNAICNGDVDFITFLLEKGAKITREHLRSALEDDSIELLFRLTEKYLAQNKDQ